MTGDGSNDSDGVSVALAKQYVAIRSPFAVAATLVYASTAALVLAARAHRMQIHRLALYLAVAGSLHAFWMCLEVIPIDLSRPDNSTVAVRPGWYGACVFIAFAAQYMSFVKALIMVWICIYVFWLVVFGQQKKQRKHEVAGALVVLLVPALFTWEPFLHHSYGLDGAVCWITGDYDPGNSSFGYIVKMAFFIAPHCLLAFVGTVLILAAIISLTKEVLCKGNSYTQRNHHWKALKEVLPLVAYPCVYYLIFFCWLIIHFCFTSISPDMNNTVAMCLIQGSSVVLLVSLFLHSSYRSLLHDNLLCKGRGPKFVATTSPSNVEIESKIMSECCSTESDPLCT